eukprot:scaffold699_cov231-Pinguiococcus_pyrenoidosus.AAC.20
MIQQCSSFSVQSRILKRKRKRKRKRWRCELADVLGKPGAIALDGNEPVKQTLRFDVIRHQHILHLLAANARHRRQFFPPCCATGSIACSAT